MMAINLCNSCCDNIMQFMPKIKIASFSSEVDSDESECFYFEVACALAVYLLTFSYLTPQLDWVAQSDFEEEEKDSVHLMSMLCSFSTLQCDQFVNR